MKPIAVVDNDTLIYFTKLQHLGIFDSLRSLFHQIHIPQQVKVEYEVLKSKDQNRAWVLERLRPNEGFYSLCTRYDTIALQMIKGKKNIHGGEAEAVAQQMKLNAQFILSNDKRFTTAIGQLTKVRVCSALDVLVMLDVRQITLNGADMLRSHFNDLNFESSDLRNAYVNAGKDVGITFSKKDLNYKCSLKKLGCLN